jgi:hypothetical protein
MSPKEPLPTDAEWWQQWIAGVQESATRARDTGRTFHVFRLEVQRMEVGGYNSDSFQTPIADVPGALQAIEEIGWTLIDSSYLFVPTKQQSHMLTDSANIGGSILGIFTFRRQLDAPPPPAKR